MIPKITIFYGSWYRYIVAVFTSFSMYFLHTKHTIFTTMPIENYNFLIVKITGNSSNFGYLLLLFLLFKKKLEICFEDLIQIQWHYCKNSMFGMQKIHRKTCKNCYFIPLPTTIEYGNFRNHSSLNLILFPLHLIQSFESQKYIEKVWEIKGNEKLPFLQAIYLQCITKLQLDIQLLFKLLDQFFCVGLASICYHLCLDSCLQTYVLRKNQKQ